LAVDAPFGDGTSLQSLRNKKTLFFQDEGISPKLQKAVQHVHAQQLGECAWQWTRRLVMAPLCNHSENKKTLFFQDKGISPKHHKAVQHVHAHQLGECAWQWTRRLVIAPLCNHSETRKLCFSKKKGSAPNSRRPCSMVTHINWVNVLGIGPAVW